MCDIVLYSIFDMEEFKHRSNYFRESFCIFVCIYHILFTEKQTLIILYTLMCKKKLIHTFTLYFSFKLRIKVTWSSQISVFPSVIVKLTVSYVATLVRHIICVIHWEKRDLLWTWSHLRVYRVQLHRYMRGVVRMVTKCCYREVILALSRENLVSVLVCRCNLCILSKAPTVLYCTEIL